MARPFRPHHDHDTAPRDPGAHQAPPDPPSPRGSRPGDDTTLGDANQFDTDLFDTKLGDRDAYDTDPYAARERQTQQLLRDAAAERSPSRKDRLRHEAAALNVDMALGVARRYHGRGIEDDDIDQVALLGLWKAVLGFQSDPAPEDASAPARTTGDPTSDRSAEHPRRFAAYAVPTITGEVKRYFRDHGWMVRPPRQVQEQTLAVHHAVMSLRQELRREPTEDEVARHAGITRRELDRARQARQGYHVQSTDTPLRADGPATLADTVPDEVDAFSLLDTRLTLGWAIDQLADGDRRLLALRYTQGLTQTDIGSMLGVSQMQVSRLLSRVHRQLHDRLVLEAS